MFFFVILFLLDIGEEVWIEDEDDTEVEEAEKKPR